MEKKIYYVFLVLLLLLAQSCDDNSNILQEREMRLLEIYLKQNGITEKPLQSGLYYIPEVEGTGLKAESSDFVLVLYTAQLIDGKVFDTTDEQLAIIKGIHSNTVLYGHSKIKLEKLNIKGIEEGLKLMKEGGKARLIIPSKLGYGPKIINNVPAYSTLIYDIELVKVIRDPVAFESEEIQNYIAQYSDSMHLVVATKSFQSGSVTHNWYYIQLNEGQGDSIKKDYKVYLYYEGRLVDGRVIDRNFGNTSPFNFTVGGTGAIKGMDLAVQEMKKDGKARVLIPSALGYGEAGSGKVPAFSPLVFDILVTRFDTVATPR